ncbi:MAG: nucleotide exchange factor GrpE [Pseudomonadota bacterium]
MREKKAAQQHSDHASPDPSTKNHTKHDATHTDTTKDGCNEHDVHDLHEEKDKKESQGSKRELIEKLEKAEKDTQELSDRLLRTIAEFDNYKKRVIREKEDLIKYGTEKLALELLPTVDNFERALEQAKNAKDPEQVLAGIDMILKQFLSALEKFQVKSFSAVGQPFDPQKHEAVVQQEHEEYADNTVMAEFQKGFYLSDKLLRPAKVIVSKRPAEETEEVVRIAEE